MKIAIFSESSADEAALRILVDALVGFKSTHVNVPIRFRGWPGVLNLLHGVLCHLYYQEPDVNLLVVVADSNGSIPHEINHLSPDPNCRFCLLRALADKTLAGLTQLPMRQPLRCAVGVAVPAMEAWLRSGQDRRVTESAWKRALASNSFPFTTHSLKRDLYGTDRPSLAQETKIMVERAIALSNQLELLEQNFPGGFAPLASTLRLG